MGDKKVKRRAAIWRSHALPRVVAFPWTVAYKAIKTCDRLKKRCFQMASWCVLCRKEEETIDHLLLQCQMAHVLWTNLLRSFNMKWVFRRSIRSVILNWKGGRFGSVGDLLWKLVPYALIWNIWKERNNRIFQGKERCVRGICLQTKIDLISRIKALRGTHYSIRDFLRHWQDIIWEKKIMAKSAGISGVIWNWKERVVMSYSKTGGMCDANEAEVRALLFGLQWCAMNLQGLLIIEGDSANTVAWAIFESIGPGRIRPMIMEIKDLVYAVKPVTEHRRRYANVKADELAKAGVLLD
ncbi:uncharacterized protein LOC143857010 [Tasmannia lanceolata]|uniref:uncharacterized protein LOC143857010 n=1 Tax=Tasmannia lanceolata TaxID=3420 RepID=UPI004064BB5F